MKFDAPDLLMHPQVQGSKLPPISSKKPSLSFLETLGILFQYYFVQFEWTLDDKLPKVQEPSDPNKPNYPHRIRGNVFVTADLNIQALVNSVKYDLREEGIDIR